MSEQLYRVCWRDYFGKHKAIVCKYQGMSIGMAVAMMRACKKAGGISGRPADYWLEPL